ncbi:MLO-like protein 4 [Ranunculus cassubicifolius]
MEVMEGRSLAETPTWSVASVTTVMVFVCLFAERSIYRFGKWLKKTRRKALFASLEKIKEELMLLGLISLLLGQCAKWISSICIDSSLFNQKFYSCSEEDFGIVPIEHALSDSPELSDSNHTAAVAHTVLNQCGVGREPFVSQEGLEQLHRFLFVLAITHVMYSCVAVGLAMIRIYSWRKWESLATVTAEENLQARKNKVMRRQTTFVFHHTSHPWSRNRVLIWMLCFLQQFRSSIEKSDYMALRLGFITKHRLPLSYNFHKYMVRSMEDEFNVIVGISWPLWGYAVLCIFINIHGLNIYFWLSFIPVILIMLVGTKLHHVVSLLALQIREATGPSDASQVKPCDDLFWFGKPDMLLWLIQFISFQNAFEMATFIWSLWGLKQHSCFMKNHAMVIVRLTSGVLVQFWCSYSTVPLNIIITQMGSKCKKALLAEIKQRSKHESMHSRTYTARSTCSLESILDDETCTVGSGTLSRCSSLNQLTVDSTMAKELSEVILQISEQPQYNRRSLRVSEYLNNNSSIEPVDNSDNDRDDIVPQDTLLDLFRKT